MKALVYHGPRDVRGDRVCLTVNPGNAGRAYGLAGMGPYSGEQAELLRVPYGNFNYLVLPPDAADKENEDGWTTVCSSLLNSCRVSCSLRGRASLHPHFSCSPSPLGPVVRRLSHAGSCQKRQRLQLPHRALK